MKKTLSLLFIAGVLLAQTNNFNGNKVDTGGGDFTLTQSNNHVSKNEMLINKKIDQEMKDVLSSNHDQKTKNFITTILGESKQINKDKISLDEKNRQCKFKAEIGAKFLKYANLNLAFSYCDKVF